MGQNRGKRSYVDRGETMEVDGIHIEVVRKRVKNVNFRVYPPDGEVRVSAPYGLDTADLWHAVKGRMDWIRSKQRRFLRSPRPQPLRMLDGEEIPVAGARHRLAVRETSGRASIHLSAEGELVLCVPAEYDTERRKAILREWYRGYLKGQLPALIRKWEPRLGVRAADWGVKRMKTRWGSCNVAARRVWVNLELARQRADCLEYVVVHELAHLKERRHNARFRRLLDHALPHWRALEAELDRVSLPVL